MKLEYIIFILLIHFLGDFVLQTNEQAKKKSTDSEFLFYHVIMYSFIWLIASYVFLGFRGAIAFTIITFICHFITDYITSRINKGFFEKGDMHNGFIGIGFDQVLHYIQLLVIFKWILEYGK